MGKIITISVAILGLFTYIIFRQISLKNTSPHILPPATSNLIHSNQWYSSLYKPLPSSPIFAEPLAYQFNPSCIGFSFPTVTATQNTVFASYREDFCVGTKTTWQRVTVVPGDWHIVAQLQEENDGIFQATIGHGLPYAILENSKVRDLTISFPSSYVATVDDQKVESTKATGDTVTFTVNNNLYILLLPAPVSIEFTPSSITIHEWNKTVIGLLDKKENIAAFKKIRNISIKQTSVSFLTGKNTLATTYAMDTNAVPSLIALYPHHFDRLTKTLLVLGGYKTLRGELKLVQTNSFTTQTSYRIPKETFDAIPKPPADFMQSLKSDIATLAKEPIPDSRDYFFGTWLGKATSLLQLADSQNLVDEKKQLIEFLSPLFKEVLDGFHYDSKLSSFIADKPEFGNEKLNDHHFHYGYYIRTAAVLSAYDPDILPIIKPVIDEMVADVMTIKRDETRYPFLRHFDIYEGHSWADGFAAFGDGNNQESSSEAINAWYAVYLWAKRTQNQKLMDYALYLYNTEIESTKYYWFNEKNIYPAPYTHAIISILWGGKVDFATWFSGKTNMIYGIQLLPLTPASLYLKEFNNFNRYEKDYYGNQGKLEEDWGDLFLIWKSMYEPDNARLLMTQVKSYEGSKSKSLFQYFLYSN